MQAKPWILMLAAGALVVGGGGFLPGLHGSAMAEVQTTVGKRVRSSSGILESQLWPFHSTSPKSAARKTQNGHADAAAAGKPRRVETTVYNSWAVTCRDNPGGAAKKRCLASFRARENRREVLLWQIGFNKSGHFVTTVHTPSALAVRRGKRRVGGAILIRNGVELKFGKGPARVLKFVMCGPRQCVAEGPVDEAFMKEAAANSRASVTIHTTGGGITLKLSIKGIDKAIASARK